MVRIFRSVVKWEKGYGRSSKNIVNRTRVMQFGRTLSEGLEDDEEFGFEFPHTSGWCSNKDDNTYFEV